MSRNLHVVFNRPPSGVSEAEFNAWALHHFREILVVPGWMSAKRFRLEPAYSFSEADEYVPPEGSLDSFPFMSLYEIEGNIETAMAELVKEVESGRMVFPSWFQRSQDESCFASWNAVPIEETDG